MSGRGLQFIPLDVRIRKQRPTPEQLLGKCIDSVIQVNTVLKEILAHRDQLDRDKMVRFMDVVRQNGKIIYQWRCHHD